MKSIYSLSVRIIPQADTVDDHLRYRHFTVFTGLQPIHA